MPRTPAVSALGISVLAHVIPLLIIGMMIGRVNPGTDLTKIAADVSQAIPWIREVGGQTGIGTPHSGTHAQQQSTRNELRRAAQGRMVPYDVPAAATIADLQVLPGVLSPLTGPPTADATPAGAGERGEPGIDGVGGRGPGGSDGSGDPFHVGNGATSPVVIKEVKPAYTPEAMRARIQGLVTVRLVVLPDGSVGAVRLVRSLDPVFGLDQEALKAVKQWRFRPGTYAGRAVSVPVDIELTFTLR